MKILKESSYSYLEGLKAKNKKRSYFAAGTGTVLLVIGFTLGNSWLILFGVITMAISVPYLRRYLNAEAGIRGERTVTETLHNLDDSYHLVNDIQLAEGKGNIDHILISPKGIFCIETKNWTGDIRCNGDYWSKKGSQRIYPVASVSKQAWRNVSDLGRILKQRNMSVPIMPICVFTNDLVRLRITRPTVPILQVTELNQYIRNRKPMANLTEKQILSIAQRILQESSNHAILGRDEIEDADVLTLNH